MFGEDPIFDVIALLYLFVVASGVRPSTQPELQQAESPLVEQIAAALEDEGFSTILSPQTGKPDVDPLIARLDIFAYRGEQALAVEIKHRAGETGSLDWRGATGLVTATRALVETPTELPEQVRSVNPLLVLVDDGPEPSLSKFCEEESIPLVSVRSAHPRQDMKKALPGILTSLSRMTGTVKL
jgi:hypothetical protein